MREPTGPDGCDGAEPGATVAASEISSLVRDFQGSSLVRDFQGSPHDGSGRTRSSSATKAVATPSIIRKASELMIIAMGIKLATTNPVRIFRVTSITRSTMKTACIRLLLKSFTFLST